MNEQQQSITLERLVAMCVIGILGILIMPLPAVAMDLLLAMNVGLAVTMMLVALRLKRALEFSVFPAMLLITTLFRLGLNVATTRLILRDGHTGPDAAGSVIQTFGEFAVGGSVVIGLVIFLILIIVNFMVITKGSGRVSEVAARFTLDALPGKQMAIDADLAAGAITEAQAQTRRSELEQEAEFFGAMDGASKFVRGDAIAGLIITGINIVGGLIAGMVQNDLGFAKAVSTYTILTVGDGLVSQMPALLISVASGIVVTRTGDRTQLGSQVSGQIFGNSQTLITSSVVMVAIGMIPGMPLFAFAGLAGGTVYLAQRVAKKEKDAERLQKAGLGGKPANQEDEAKSEQETLEDLLQVDTLELEVGYGLLALIDVDRGGELPGRITSLRKQLAAELGIILPSVHLRDNLNLEANDYRVVLRGVEVAKGVAFSDRMMALEGTGQLPDIKGIEAKEPAFGLPAMWVEDKHREEAETKGFTLVDGPSVITTHLSEVLKKIAHELVGRQEVQELLNMVGREAPKLVEDVVPNLVSLGELVGVVRGLLKERISVRDMVTILEAVADASTKSKELPYMIEQTRKRMARHITATVCNDSGAVHAMTLTRHTEELLRGTMVAADGEPMLTPDLDVARKLMEQLEQNAQALASAGLPTVVIAPSDLRRPLFDFANRFLGDLSVVTARELSPGTQLEPTGIIEFAPRPA